MTTPLKLDRDARAHVGVGRSYRDVGWLERVASGSAQRTPQWLRSPLKRVYLRLLGAVSGGHLICRLPGGESFRVDPEFRQVGWNAEEYAALKRSVGQGSTVLDIGANVGAYTLLFATWAGSTGRVVAFEPATASRTGLLRHLEMNGLLDRVEVRTEAVGEASGTASFVDAGTRGDNRLVGADIPGASPVRVVSIDDFCATANLAPDVIKIDVEGAELMALRGGRRTIAARGAALALFVELHPRLWPELGASRRQIEEELHAQRLVIEPLPGVSDPWAVEGICVRLRPA